MPNWITITLLVALIGGWGWVLGRPLIHTVFNRAHRDPVGHFSRQLDTLGQAPRNSVSSFGAQPRATHGVRQRRRQIMLALVIAAVVSLGFALFSGGIFVAQHLVLDAALVGYVVAASRAGNAEAERRHKVSYLDSGNGSSQPSYLRAASDR